jgi:hypothetical protein
MAGGVYRQQDITYLCYFHSPKLVADDVAAPADHGASNF